MNKAIFLDRDGTINVEKSHLYKKEDWDWIPGAVDAIKGFHMLGYLVIVVSNQSGVARGLYNCEDVERLHTYINALLHKTGTKIDGFYYCPHHPDFCDKVVCNCRKPAPGLIFSAQAAFDIDLNSSYTIGDKASDLEAGFLAGTTPIMVTTGYGREELYKIRENTLVTKDIITAFELVKSRDMKI